MKHNGCRNRPGETVIDSQHLLLDIKIEVKREIENQISPLRDAIIHLNSLLPVCDLTTGESDIEISDSGSDSEDEIQGPPISRNSLDDFSGSIQFDTDPVISRWS